MPRFLRSSKRNIFTCRAVHVDVGEVNGRVFANNSGIDFYPHFVRQREEQERRRYVKRVAFMLAFRVRRYLRLRIGLHMDQREALEHLTPFLFVGNNRYRTSGPEIGTRAKLDGGRLWVCTAPRTVPENFLCTALSTVLGRAVEQQLNIFETEEISVQPGTKRVNMATDGEVTVMDAPLHFVIRPHALMVVVPTR